MNKKLFHYNILNDLLKTANIGFYKILSNKARKLYLKPGILVQGMEANKYASNINATLGVAKDSSQHIYLNILNDIFKNSSINPNDIIGYSSSSGNNELRASWKKEIFDKNPFLKKNSCNISTPIVTNGLTHALSLTAEVFMNPDDILIIQSPYWGNYNGIFVDNYNVKILQYDFFVNNKFNLEGFKKIVNEACILNPKKVSILFNLPSNPYGYTIKHSDMLEVAEFLKVKANNTNILCISDDAYFNFFYEKDICTQSPFSYLSGVHDNIFTVKIDGATKELYSWGFRIGFITFACKKNPLECYDIIENKVSASIRSSLSNISNLSQKIVLKYLESDLLKTELIQKHSILKSRYVKTKSVIQNKKYSESIKYYEFNSGYFMCIKPIGVDTEKLRLHLLHKYNIGVINIGGLIRIAFSCIDENKIEELFDSIHKSILFLKST